MRRHLQIQLGRRAKHLCRGIKTPGDVAFDSAGNLFFVDYDGDEVFGKAAVYKITPNGVRTTLPPD